MELSATVRDYSELRKILRKFVEQAFHISVTEYIKQHHLVLKKCMFYDSRQTKGKRDRGMSIEQLKTICDTMGITLHIVEGNNVTKDVTIDLTDRQHPLVIYSPKNVPSGTVRQDDIFEIKTTAILINDNDERNQKGQLMLQMNAPDRFGILVERKESIAENAQILVGYVRSYSHYKLLLDHGLYYVRIGTDRGCVDNNFFSQLPDYLIVLPKQTLKKKMNDGSLQYEYPYSIRIFKIRKDKPNGPGKNDVLDQLGFEDYDPKHSHGFIYLDCEVIGPEINQLEATTVLWSHFVQNYRPYTISHSALISLKIYQNPKK